MQPLLFNLSQHPTADTLRLLASLLERMTAANDQINKARKDNVRRASSASMLAASSSHAMQILTSSPSSSNHFHPPPPPLNPEDYTRFHARSIPTIDIYSYLARIHKYCPAANECFLSLLVYFDRMSKNAFARTKRPFTIDSYNIHRLIITGVMVASKFFSDVFYTNTRYAKVGGLPTSELNSLELEFLVLNDFNASVATSELQRYGDQLLKVGYMGQEILKSFIYEAPSYNRQGRSTSLCYPQQLLPRQQDSMDHLCDMASSMNFGEHRRAAFVASSSFPKSGYVANMHSPHSLYNATPISNQDTSSSISLGDDHHHNNNCRYQHTNSPMSNSSSSGDGNSGEGVSTFFARQRHGSSGSLTDHHSRQYHHNIPRQSRSSVNLCQSYAGFSRKSITTPPSGLDGYPAMNFISDTNNTIVAHHAAAAAAAAAHAAASSYYTYSCGIPTPPPSSSPHQKQSTPSATTAQPPPRSLMYL